MNGKTDDTLCLDNQLCFPLYACARRVVGKYTPFLKPLNLTYTQYIVFLVLWQEKTLSVRELGRRLFLDSGTLTPVLKKMEAEGYVERTRSAEDERVVTISLTEAGLAMRDRAKQIPGQVGACMKLSQEEAATLYTLLYRLLKDTEED